MSKAINFLGKTAYYLLMPVWYVYFRLNPIRTRVIMIHDSQVLLVNGFLSGGDWGFPGGGVSRGETLEECAIRELNEELGILVAKNQLTDFGEHTYIVAKATLRAHYFRMKIDAKPNIRPSFPEISDAKWFGPNELNSIKLSKDTVYALSKLKML